MQPHRAQLYGPDHVLSAPIVAPACQQNLGERLDREEGTEERRGEPDDRAGETTGRTVEVIRSYGDLVIASIVSFLILICEPHACLDYCYTQKTVHMVLLIKNSKHRAS